jgi:hypothetical protein
MSLTDGTGIDFTSTQGFLGSVVALLLAGGGSKYVFDLVKDARDRKANAPSDDEIANKEMDHSFLTVVRAKEQLEIDNSRLRGELTEEREAHREQRAEWQAERERMRQEIAALETQVRQQRDEFNVRATELLAQIHDLQDRAARMTR